MKKTAFQLFQVLGAAITSAEAQRDYTEEGLNEKEEQFYNVLNFCFDLLARTDFNTETVHEIPEAAGHEGENTDFNPLSVSSDAFADMVFNIATKTGNVDLREVLKRFMKSQKEAAELIGKRPATISEYLNKKSSFNCDSYEKIINSYLN